jgi:hypothetical protein
MDDGTRVVRAGLPEPEQGTPFLPGPVFAAPFHLQGEVDSSPWGYTRYGNPTWERYEAALAELEGGEVVLFASGMAAAAALLLTSLRPGSAVAIDRDCYLNVRRLARTHLEPRGVDVRLAHHSALPDALQGAAMVWLESPSNPKLDVYDIGALAESPLRDYLEARFWLIAEGPEWGDRNVKGMADLMDRKRRFKPRTAVEDGDIYFAFGYNEARAVTTVLEQAVENGDLSREGILEAIQDVETVEFDGLGEDYTYGPIDERSPGRQSSMFEVDASRPFGLKALETNFSSDAAEAFEF